MKTKSASRFKPFGILPIHPIVQIEIALRERDRQALQAVMEGFGDAVEIGTALDHFPMGVDAQFAHQRHHPTENLGHAAAGAGRVDMHDSLAGETPANWCSRLIS